MISFMNDFGDNFLPHGVGLIDFLKYRLHFDKADTVSVQNVGGSDTIEKPYSFHSKDFRIRTIYCFLYGSYMCINASTNAFVQKH